MPFNMLIATCLLGNMEYIEGKVNVYFEKAKPSEKVLFFKIDDEHTEDWEVKPRFRGNFYKSNQESSTVERNQPRKGGVTTLVSESEVTNEICDLLIYYSPDNTVNSIFCLTELKSRAKPGDFEKAFKQLCNTYRNCFDKFSSAYEKHDKRITWVGCACCYSGGTPTYEDKNIVIDFKSKPENKNCKLDLRVFPLDYVSEYEPFFRCDMGQFLRQIYNHKLKQYKNSS